MGSFKLAFLLVATVLALPTDKKPDLPKDAEAKPVSAPPAAAPGDDYDAMHASWHEPAAEPNKEYIPQSGSLLGLDAEKAPPDPDVIPKDPTTVVPPVVPGSAAISDVSAPDMVNKEAVHPNPEFQHYPVYRDQTEAAYKESSEKIAGPTVKDPERMDVHGVPGPTVTFDRPEAPHPMEEKTPLADNNPCDPTRVLEVSIPAATSIGTLPNGMKVPVLPARYGCSSATDVSREKLSPEISWTNVSSDVFEFSLQMINMGDMCEKKGPDYGLIQWHVTGIKSADKIILKEGASHDSRMLYGGQEQPNQWLEDYYSGPCPTPGTTGCYRFKVLAHRANGWCQCGFQDVLFIRPEKLPDLPQ